MKAIIRKIFYASVLFTLIISGCRQSNEEGSDVELISSNLYHVENISIFQPKENDYFHPGEIINIKWDLFSPIAETDIFLYRKSQSQFAIILKNNNTGSYSWQIPHNIRHSLHYSIKVVNSSNNREFDFSGSFSILEE